VNPTPPQFCCDSARDRFGARNDVGEFLVAGGDPVQFFAGFNMAHRTYYSDVVVAARAAASALDAAGISNVKLAAHGIAHYCSQCGVKLVDFYGPDGGALRDDHYVAQMRSPT
jgi:hypothetical protein